MGKLRLSPLRNHQGSAKYAQSSERNGLYRLLWPNLCVLSTGYEFGFTRWPGRICGCNAKATAVPANAFAVPEVLAEQDLFKVKCSEVSEKPSTWADSLNLETGRLLSDVVRDASAGFIDGLGWTLVDFNANW
ncbi:hypothetical protein EAI_06375 [Harpegnathos saltator]|uniref:Uncharacterized protein n=1 Tax=Harpegnathos saltator TaxID=610380 RepID=E2BGI8_HARSA|nr:hypothetical protein EAI_06375 [Harpegnathos saltator]